MESHPPFKKISCFGAGFVGTPTTAILALNNPLTTFYVYDINKTLIQQWNQGCPIHEQGLQQILNKVRNVNLFFTTQLPAALSEVDVIYIAVPTPTKTFGEGKDKCHDLSYIEAVARSISYYFKQILLQKEIVVLEKSTVPVFTHQTVEDILKENQTISSNKDKFVVISNPEFLSEGTTVHDILHPDRIVYGSSNREDIIDKLVLLHPYVEQSRIIRTSNVSSQFTKLVSNCFLAQRISSINSIGLLTEKVGGDIGEIKKCIGADTRIGNKFINPSVGFGGSCFKKDVLALVYLAQSKGLNEVADYWSQVIVLNEYRKKRFFGVILEKMYNTVRNKKFAILGLSYKKGTNDVRDSAAGKVCELLLEEGAILQIYDPMVRRQKFIEQLKYQRLWKDEFQDKLIEMKSVSDSIQDTHAIVILTEWDQFITQDYASYYQRMHKPSYIFDGRNILKEKEVVEIGFKYFRIGHKH